MKRFLYALVLCVPTTAAAQCTGGALEVFHCDFPSGKQVDLCLQDGVVLYQYGAPGLMPELILGRSAADVDMQPWPGAGSTIWDEVHLLNGDTTYSIARWLDRNDLTAVPEGSVSVSRGGQTIVRLECASGTVRGDLYPIYDAQNPPVPTTSH